MTALTVASSSNPSSSLPPLRLSPPPLVPQVDTTIGYASDRAGTSAAHHGAFGSEQAEVIRRRLDWSHRELFFVPEEVYRWARGMDQGARTALLQLATPAPSPTLLL